MYSCRRYLFYFVIVTDYLTPSLSLQNIDILCGNNDTSDFATSATLRKLLSDAAVIERTRNCHEYFHGGVAPIPAAAGASSTANFNLAFAVSVYHQAALLELLLASVALPGGAFCIHVDAKVADETVSKAVRGLVRCYREESEKARRGLSFLINFLCETVREAVALKKLLRQNLLFSKLKCDLS